MKEINPMRLIPKREVMARVGVTYVTIWRWMREGTFPRSRVVGYQSMWFESEVDAWIADRPIRELKGDFPTKPQLRIGSEIERNTVKQNDSRKMKKSKRGNDLAGHFRTN